MNEDEVLEKVKEIIAYMADLEISEIDMDEDFSVYIRPNSKRILAAKIDVKFPNVNGTILYNALFSEIVTGEEIVEFILEYY